VVRFFLAIKAGLGFNHHMKTETFKCDVCGKTEKLQSGKHHWCDCNPAAPFYFVSLKHRSITERVSRGIESLKATENWK